MAKPAKTKILFDAGPLVNGQKSGVGHYTAGLISALATAYPEELELVGHYFDFLGRKGQMALPEAPNIRYRRTRLFPGKLPSALRRLGLSLPFELFVKERGDLHLFPSFLGWPSLFGTQSAVAIHDLSYLDYPQYVSPRNQRDLERFVPASLKRAALVITISEATKASIQQHYSQFNKPIVVGHIPPTAMSSVRPDDAERIVKQLGITGQYILFVGTIEPRKNLEGLLDAYAQLPAATQQLYSLVLAGGKGWHDEAILSKIAGLQQQGLSVIQTGYVDETQRAALYQKAALFALPSHYEGFGMPLLEAMHYRVPVVTSDLPVLHEVAGEAAVYCDPTSPESIAKSLGEVLDNTELHDKLVAAGQRQLAKFSWTTVAHDIYQAIASILQQDRVT